MGDVTEWETRSVGPSGSDEGRIVYRFVGPGGREAQLAAERAALMSTVPESAIRRSASSK